MIKVKYSALIELECEASEHTSGILPFEKIAKRFDGGRFMDEGVRRFIANGFGDEGWTVKVTRQNAELWRED